MSHYYKVKRQSSTFSGTEDFKSLWRVFVYLHHYFAHNRHPSKYTFTITQEYGWELVEKQELKRLKEKYES